MEGACKYSFSARCMGSYWTAPAKPVGGAVTPPPAEGADASAEQYTDLGPNEVRQLIIFYWDRLWRILIDGFWCLK